MRVCNRSEYIECVNRHSSFERNTKHNSGRVKHWQLAMLFLCFKTLRKTIFSTHEFHLALILICHHWPARTVTLRRWCGTAPRISFSKWARAAH